MDICYYFWNKHIFRKSLDPRAHGPLGPWTHGPLALGLLGSWAHGPMGPWAHGSKTFPKNVFILKIIVYVQKNNSITKKTNPFKSVLKVDKIKKLLFPYKNAHPFRQKLKTEGHFKFCRENVKISANRS